MEDVYLVGVSAWVWVWVCTGVCVRVMLGSMPVDWLDTCDFCLQCNPNHPPRRLPESVSDCVGAKGTSSWGGTIVVSVHTHALVGKRHGVGIGWSALVLWRRPG
jgi:hypothetical protein